MRRSLGDGGAGDVAFESFAIGAGDVDSGVEGEAVLHGEAGALRQAQGRKTGGRLEEGVRIAPDSRDQRSARVPPLDGGCIGGAEGRRFQGQWWLFAEIVAVGREDTGAAKPGGEALAERGEELADLGVSGVGEAVEEERTAGREARVDAVDPTKSLADKCLRLSVFFAVPEYRPLV